MSPAARVLPEGLKERAQRLPRHQSARPRAARPHQQGCEKAALCHLRVQYARDEDERWEWSQQRWRRALDRTRERSTHRGRPRPRRPPRQLSQLLRRSEPRFGSIFHSQSTDTRAEMTRDHRKSSANMPRDRGTRCEVVRATYVSARPHTRHFTAFSLGLAIMYTFGKGATHRHRRTPNNAQTTVGTLKLHGTHDHEPSSHEPWLAPGTSGVRSWVVCCSRLPVRPLPPQLLESLLLRMTRADEAAPTRHRAVLSHRHLRPCAFPAALAPSSTTRMVRTAGGPARLHDSIDAAWCR